ncbi:MAG: KR domain-containing protein [Synechococcaceae cyanobacterium]|nr:KR domain-containing protein [Synechococcaceae cyanobacterium]
MAVRLQADGISSKSLPVSHAFHSALLDPMLAELEAIASQLDLRAPQLPLVSNCSGALIGAEMASAAYWRRQARQPVRFADGVATLVAAGATTFVEIGPGGTLLGLARACVADDAGYAWLPSLRRGAAARTTILESAASLSLRGQPLDLVAVSRGAGPRRRVDLPFYPFQRKRHWPESKTSLALQELHSAAFAAGTRVFALALRLSDFPYFNDHQVRGEIVVPAAAFLSLLLNAAQRLSHQPAVLHDLEMPRALVLRRRDRERLVQVLVESDDASSPAGVRLRLVSLEEGGSWQIHATARLSFAPSAALPQPPPDGPDAARSDAAARAELRGASFYARLAQLGYDFGPAFQGLRRLWTAGDAATAEVELPAGLNSREAWHPALLDACLQATAGTWLFGPEEGLWLPVAIDRCQLEPLPAGERLRVSVRRHGDAEGRLRFDLWIARLDGQPLGCISGQRSLRGDLAQLAGPAPWRSWLWVNRWREQPLPRPARERLRSPEALLEAVGSCDERLRGAARERCYGQAFVAIEQLALAYSLAGLQSLGLRFEAHSVLGPETAAVLGVIPSQRRLFARLLQILGEAGILKAAGDGWQVCRTPTETDREALLHSAQATLQRHGDAIAGELALLERCGPALPAILTGRMPPLELLFPEGDLGLTTAVYQHSPVFAPLGALIADLGVALRQPGAEAEALSILEIGAGTGSTTRHLLQALPRQSLSYTFTDVSPLFLRKAAEAFADQPGMRYALLDIERPPQEQGFQGQRHDLIVAANVLHATRSIDDALSHVASLLAPGGVLLLLEVTSRQRWADLTFGLLDGWWRFADGDLRPDYALLPTERWRDRLAAAGFDSIAAIPVDHAPARVEGLGSVSCAHTLFVARRGSAIPGAAPGAGGAWLVLQQGGDPTAAAVVAALRARGDAALGVELLDPGAAPPRSTWSPNPSPALHDTPSAPSLRVEDSHDGFAALLAAHPNARGILHLASLAAPADSSDGDALMRAARRGCGSLLHLLQATLERDTRPPIWIVSRGGQALAEEAPDPAAAMLLGMAKAVAEEHPDLALLRIDLDPAAAADARALEPLLAELDAPGPRDAEVALRGPAGAGRWVARLQRPEVGAPREAARGSANRRPCRLPAERTTVISGAFGGLGPLLARWAVDHGARRLLLLGRRAAGPAVEAEAAALRARGVEVELAIADVSDGEALQAALAGQPPVGAVLHAVGSLDDGLLMRQSWERFAAVLAPKVRGACNLERATANDPLEHFILFSSATALLGNAGQANHAAANACLDALARRRRRRGQPAVSIQWGRWGQIGAGADPRLDAHFAAKGFGTIDPELGLAALTGVVEADHEVVAVLPIDVQRFLARPLAEGVEAFFAEVAPPRASRSTETLQGERDSPPPQTAAALKADSKGAPSCFADQLAALPLLDRRSHLNATLYAVVEDVLGLGRGDLDDPSQGLSDLGLDSLLAVELRNRLQQQLGCRLPATLAFDHRTPERLATHLAEQVFSALLEADSPPAGDRLDGLSLDALAELLEGRLAP